MSHFAYVVELMIITRSIFAIPLDFEIAKLTCMLSALQSVIVIMTLDSSFREHLHCLQCFFLPVHPASFVHNFISGMQNLYFSESQNAMVLQTS